MWSGSGYSNPAAEVCYVGYRFSSDCIRLAIEDAGKAHQQPKLEQYGNALFVVATNC